MKAGAKTMYDHGPKKQAAGASKSTTAEAERRSSDRHIFTAAAEVVELSSGARFSTRTTDLGPGGCFIDTLIPLPIGARVHVGVRKGRTQLDTNGVVVYSQAGLGMGIAFDSLNKSQREALEKWLMEITGSRALAFDELAPRPKHRPALEEPDQSGVKRLVRLLISKGLITAAEGASVLYDPIL
ncbi:MAG: PilZ domain-containing protein [Acidobacteriota bacterium]|nr:PilZ domain-containing protein [Acidobacteriota bacterium]